ncbi:fibronectin type III domain-containing protein [Paenibacillus sp. 1011MAR3C5]|uniref:fibronectin type III domain-containing protein n=1 Tax=Paenibacillus sp. 1011MAR3C5 TaxID=1675787 RepID=UPI000E6CB73C|nr:fibronectin type III domain-containing protein [Paenibacillus sp. 1011MAR3C5]RJE86928.1 fibronectin type III domain-containing protein [Paenibacillus sp. 1011MAR3C5]
MTTHPIDNIMKYPNWYNPNTRTIQDIIADAPLRPDAEKIYVRVDDISMNAIARASGMGEIAALLAQHNMSFIGLGTASNQDQIYKLLENIGHNGTFLNNGNMKTAFSDLSSFITVRREVNLHVIIGETPYTEQEIRDRFNQRLIDLRRTNIRINMQVMKADRKNLQELLYLAHWDYNKNNYIVYVHSPLMPELNDELVYDDTITTLKEYSAHFLGIGSTTNRTTLNNIVASNNKLGAFYDNINLVSAVTSTMNYIKDTAITNVKKLTNYIVLNADPATGEYSSEITVQTYYEDVESDPKRTERWRTTHDPEIYENNMGMLEGTGQYMLEPMKYFTKVGMYEIVAQVQDNPSTNPLFDEYRQWSKDSLSRMVVYVHRAPVADFKAIVDPTRRLTVTDLSYDLDRYSYPDRGVIQKVWKWKRVDDASWTDGQAPSVLNPNTDYLISLRVKDLDGAWSPETIRFVSTNPFNRPPVALFTIDNKTISLNGAATFTDQSYDPDNDSIGQRVWTVKKGNVQLYQGANKPSGALIKQYAAQQGLTALGKYTISLRVKDNPRVAEPLWSNTHTEFLDIVNYPPIAQFDPLEPTYRDDLNTAINRTVNPDRDGDPVSYQWRLMYGSKEFAMGTTRDLSFRIRDRGLGKTAVGTWMLQLKASDPHGASTYETHSFDVLNHVPISTIMSGTWTGYIYEPYTYTSTRSDKDTEDVDSLKSYWKLTAPDGQIRTFDKQNISISFEQKGKYLLENWAVDQLGAVSEIDSREIHIVNQKPIPGFTMMPTPAFIDTIVRITSTATDMDGYIDKHQYFVTPPNGIQSPYTQLVDFERIFASIGQWHIRQMVTDNDGAIAEITQSLMVHNRPPSVVITTPSGATSATATEFNTLTPRIIWQMSDPDGHTGQRYRLQIKRENGALIYDTQPVTASRNYHDVPSSAGLVEHTRYRAEVQVYDGYEWSPYSAPKYFYIMLNRPPVADFTWSPQPLYEGDTVSFRTNVSDEDKDVLSIQYELISPSGNKIPYSYTFNHPYPVTGPAVRLTQLGTWSMKLTVSDGKAVPVIVTKTLQVLPLGVTGAVKHTDLWNEHRQAYNMKESGNKESPRGYNVFWAGEKFMLEAGTTATGTATRAERVEATMGAFRTELKASGTVHTRWTGELWDSTFENLPNGMLTFVFTAHYNNGTVKREEIDVHIRGNMNGYLQVHRVK